MLVQIPTTEEEKLEIQKYYSGIMEIIEQEEIYVMCT